MNQIRITSSDFYSVNDVLIPDAIMDESDLAAIKSIANPVVSRILSQHHQVATAQHSELGLEVPTTNTPIIKEQKYDVAQTGRSRIS